MVAAQWIRQQPRSGSRHDARTILREITRSPPSEPLRSSKQIGGALMMSSDSTLAGGHDSGRSAPRSGRDDVVTDDSEQPTVRLVYGDFGDPVCALASQRVDALNTVGAGVRWRAVEQHPDVPVMGCQFSSPASRDLDSLMSAVVGRLLPGEGLRWNKPGFAVHTQASCQRLPKRTAPASATTCADCCSAPIGSIAPTSETLRSCAG